MQTLNTSNKHGIKQFSFRKPIRGVDDVVHITEHEDKVTEISFKTFDYFPVSLPVVVFHRDHPSRVKPIVPEKTLGILRLPGSRRYNHQIHLPNGKVTLLMSHFYLQSSNQRLTGHTKRMEREQCTAYCRRQGILNPSSKQLESAHIILFSTFKL